MPSYYYEPQRTIIIFGTGVQGRIIDERPGLVSDEGIEEVEFLMQPSEMLMRYYNLNPRTDLDQDGYIRRRYPTSDIEPLTRSAICPTTLIKCGFNWEDTPLTTKNMERELIQDLQIKIKTLQRTKAKLQEEIRKMLTQQREWAKDHTDLIQEFRRSQGQSYEEGMEPQGPDYGGEGHG